MLKLFTSFFSWSRDYTFSVSTWKQHGNNPPLLLPPPRLTSRQRLFAWSVFWLQLQLARRRSLSEEESEGRDVDRIRGGGLLCFTSEEERGNGLKFEDKVSDTESKGKKAASSLVSVKWSYPPRESTSLRWRASRRSAAERFVSRALKGIF